MPLSFAKSDLQARIRTTIQASDLGDPVPRHVIDIGPTGRRWGAGLAIEDRYRPMVAELEHMAQSRPAAYRRVVLWGALVGYGFILVVAMGLLLAALTSLWVVSAMHLTNRMLWLIIAVLVALWPVALGYLAGALWVGFERPKGHKLKRHQAPELFALLDRVRHALKSPWVNQVLITQDFNAAMVQKPRLGVFGWPENYLLLGLPLLQALSPEEVTAVVAHEYGHLAGAHGTWAGWIYRTRQTWAKLGGADSRGWTAGLFQRFLKWYGPWFSARTFVFARHNEYHADRCSADVAGARHTASALTRVSVEGHRFARYWHGLHRLSRVQERPGQLPFSGLASYFTQPGLTRDHRLALNVALGEDTDVHDTHPCLLDRLKALGEPMPDLAPLTRSGASAYLGDDLTARLVIAFDAEWWTDAQPAWEHAFEAAQGLRARMDELRSQSHPLDAEACWELAHLHEGFGDIAGAVAVAETHLAPLGNPEALRVFAGRLLLEDGQARGLSVLAPVLASREVGLRLVALRAMTAYYAAFDPQGPGRAVAEVALEVAEERQEVIREAFGRLDDGDVLTRAPLEPGQIATLRDIAAKAPFIRALWVAHRVLPDDPATAQYVALFLRGNRPVAAHDKDAFMEAVLDVLGLHAYVLLLEWDSEREWLRERLAATKGTQIYSDKRRVMKN